MKVAFVILISSAFLTSCNNTYSKTETGVTVNKSSVGGSVNNSSGGQTVSPNANPNVTATVSR